MHCAYYYFFSTALELTETIYTNGAHKTKRKNIPPSWYNVYKTGILFRPSKLLGLFFIHTHTHTLVHSINSIIFRIGRTIVYIICYIVERIFHCRHFKVAVDGTHIILYYFIIISLYIIVHTAFKATRRTYYVTPRYWLWSLMEIDVSRPPLCKKTRTRPSDCATT